MGVEKYTTHKGKTGIIVDGYKYRLDKAFKSTDVWMHTEDLQCPLQDRPGRSDDYGWSIEWNTIMKFKMTEKLNDRDN